MPIVVNMDAGPCFNGAGDTIIMAWLAEGTRNTSQPLQVFSAIAGKKTLLRLLGQTPYPSRAGVCPSGIYSMELANRGSVSRMQRAGELLGITSSPKRPPVMISSDARKFAADYWGPSALARRIVLCPECNDTSREWPHWADFKAKLGSIGHCVIRELTKDKCLSSWPNAAAVLEAADVVIGVDSAYAHLAATLNRPTIVVMGPTRASVFAYAECVTCVSAPSQLRIVPRHSRWQNSQQQQLHPHTQCTGCCFGSPFGLYCKQRGCEALAQISPEVVLEGLPPMSKTNGLFYRTYAQLAEDVRCWSRSLPADMVAVCGLSRSGLIVASMLFADRNIHVVTEEDLRQQRRPWETALRRNCPAKTGGYVLVVDDTVSSGDRMQTARQELGTQCGETRIEYGAVYAMEIGISAVDHYYKNVGEIPHLFEWNWPHHWFLSDSLVDMDGAICGNWPHTSEDGPLADKYLQHLTDAPILVRPSFEIGEIVTSRLERHRVLTETWLARHRVAYRKLTMAPYATSTDRERHNGATSFKVTTYKQRTDAMLFIESEWSHAQTIAKLTGRPVLCTENQVLLNGTEV